MRTVATFLLATTASLVLAAHAVLAQQSYPSRNVHVIVPFAAGGAADLVARVMAEGLSKRLGQGVIVENRPGATGSIGSLAVARAEPDGHTILMTVISSHAVQPVLKKQAPFDPIADFTPIVRISNSIHTLVARNDIPASNAAELVAYAKANPGKLNYGSSGVGSFPHLGAKIMERTAGIEMVHVPFSGDAPAMQAVISKNIDLLFTPSARSYVDAKNVKLIGVGSLKPSPIAPDWPLLDKTGLPGFELVSWLGFMGPAKLAAAIADRLNKATNETLAEPAIRSRLEQIGYTVAGGTAAEFAAAIRNDIARFKALNISID